VGKWERAEESGEEEEEGIEEGTAYVAHNDLLFVLIGSRLLKL